MKQAAWIAGAGMTAFGKFPARGLKSLAAEAITLALRDAGIEASDLQAAYMGNAAASVITGQVMVPGEVVLRGMGIGRIPVVNVENACATSATAFEQAATMVTLGRYDTVLVAGFEKLYSPDKEKSFSVFRGAVDVEDIDRLSQELRDGDPAAAAGASRSMFMDIYARMARAYMRRSGATREHFAMVAAKASVFGSLNPHAQYRQVQAVADVLAANVVCDPLTLPMCCPLGDGAAALVVMSERRVRELGIRRAVKVRATELASGWDRAPDAASNMVVEAAKAAYGAAGIEPGDVDVVELHDAAAPAEPIYLELLGLCAPGEGIRLVEQGATGPGGRIPVNPSGGLLRRGHPIGASGCAQLVELVHHLRGEAGARQVAGARLALAENGGGWIGEDPAAIVISVLEAAP